MPVRLPIAIRNRSSSIRIREPREVEGRVALERIFVAGRDRRTTVLWLRWVTGMPAYAGAAIADVMPGTISNGNTGFEQCLRFLAAAPEHEQVAALEAHDGLPVSASLTISAVISVCGRCVRLAFLPT